MKLYVDDIREAPEGYSLCRTNAEAVRALAFWRNEIDEVSLDFDAGHGETFEVVAYYLRVINFDCKENKIAIRIHTDNPAGMALLKSILNWQI